MSYEAYDDSWWGQDKPFDSHSLAAIRDNFRAVWEDCAPAVPCKVKEYFTDASLQEEQEAVSFFSPVCVWLRPFFLLPGTKALKLHVDLYAEDTDDVTFWFGHGPEAMNLNAAPVELGNDQVIHSHSTYTDREVITLTREWGLDVDRPQFTYLQLWQSCDKVGVSSNSSDFDAPPELKAGGTLVEDVPSMGLSGNDRNVVLEAYNSNDDRLWRRDVLGYNSGYSSSYFEVYPALSYTPEVSYFKLESITWSWISSVCLEIVRDDGESLYLPADSELKGGAECTPSIMDKFDSEATRAVLGHRPATFYLPPTSNANVVGETPHLPVNVAGGEYKEIIPLDGYLRPLEGDSDTVPLRAKCLLLASARNIEAGRNTSADFDLKLVHRDSSGDPTYTDTDSFDDVDVPGMDQGNGGRTLMSRWDSLPQKNLMGCLGEQDVDNLSGLATVVLLEVSLDWTPDFQDTDSDPDVEDGHSVPWELELSYSSSDEVLVFPYVWVEAENRP